MHFLDFCRLNGKNHTEIMRFTIMNKLTGEDMKKCNTCGQERGYEFFSPKKKKSGSVAYQSSCKPCRAEASRLARKENPEAVRASARLINSKKTDEQKKVQSDYLAAWRIRNKEKVKAYRTKDRVQEYSRAHYERHKEEIKDRVSQYRKSNPNKVRALNHARRGLERSGKLSSNIIEILFFKQKGLCVCCKKKLGKDFHLDHIVPLSMGGTNTDDNVQLLKPRCNLQKNAKHPVDFMRERGYLL
jgi:5-methylcytosine-specific restriction endonuclease McrA